MTDWMCSELSFINMNQKQGIFMGRLQKNRYAWRLLILETPSKRWIHLCLARLSTGPSLQSLALKKTLQILFIQAQFLIKDITKNTIFYLCCDVVKTNMMCKSVFPILWDTSAKEKLMLMTTGRKVYVKERIVRHTLLHLLYWTSYLCKIFFHSS